MTKLTVASILLIAFLWPRPFASRAATEGARESSATGSAQAASTADSLDRLLGPIALYPDALLSEILLCSTNPGKVGALEEWLRSHESLKGGQLQDAAREAGFDESFAALVVFPDVVGYMAEQMKWTTALGQAFTTDRSAVFASIQRLRGQARAAGTLKTTPQQEVETRKTESGQEVIVIEPANPQVIYVPQYNPEVVYVEQSSSNANAVAAGVIGFTAGIAIGAAIDNDYYYGPYGARGGFYMYDDAFDDYYDAREDAREDWQDNREDLYEQRSDTRENVAEERTDRAGTTQQQRTERTEARQENRPQTQATQAQAQQRRSDAQASGTRPATTGATSQQARGYSGGQAKTAQRSGSGSDAFSGYSSGKSEKAASQRGQSSRSSSRGGGGGGGGGGRRR